MSIVKKIWQLGADVVLYPSISQGGESYVFYQSESGVALAIILGLNL